MKQTIILALALLAASCGGGGTSTTTTTTQPDTTAALSKAESAKDVESPSEPLARTIMKQILETQKTLLTKAEFDDIQWDCDPSSEHVFVQSSLSDYSLNCFPKGDGEYLVLFEIVMPEDGDCVTTEYTFFTYKNGVIAETKNFLPKPKITDFYANSDQFPKEAVEALNEIINIDYDYCRVCYYADNALHIGFYPFTDEMPAPLRKFENKEAPQFPIIRYLWDGEKFVRDPNDKPFVEDLKYFDFHPTGDFASSGKSIDDLYSLSKDSLSIAEGDLNRDGKKDLVAAEKHGGKLAVYWGVENGYVRFKTYETTHNITAKIFNDTTLYIEATFEEEDNDSRSEIEFGYTLHFQNNDLYMTEGRKFIDYASSYGATHCYGGNYDFINHTVQPINDNGNYDCEEHEPIPAKPLKTLSDIAIGEYHFEDYQ
jgi:hypothetical protein